MAPSAIIADIVLIEHRGLLHGWLIGQIDIERKRQKGETPPSRNRSGRKAPDPRQDWLDLPEFQHIRAEVQGDTLEEFQERIAALERIAAEKEKSDKRELLSANNSEYRFWIISFNLSLRASSNSVARCSRSTVGLLFSSINPRNRIPANS
jgi:hypothetical protein